MGYCQLQWPGFKESTSTEFIREKTALLHLRNNLLIQIETFFTEHNLSGSVYLKQLQANRPQDSRLIVEQLIEEIQHLPGPETKRILFLKIQEADQQLLLLQRKLPHATLEYNNLVRKMPSRIVATVFGFKPKLPA